LVTSLEVGDKKETARLLRCLPSNHFHTRNGFRWLVYQEIMLCAGSSFNRWSKVGF